MNPNGGQSGTCYWRWDDAELVVGNDCVQRRWRVDGRGLLHALSFVDRSSGREWFTKAAEQASLCWGQETSEGVEGVELGARELESGIVVDLSVGARMYRVRVLAGVAGVTVQLRVKGDAEESRGQAVRQAQAEQSPGFRVDVVEAFEIDPLHVDFTAVRLADQTDKCDNLAFESRWLLHPAEAVIEASGDVFSLERRLSGEGLVFIKHAPLPHARPVKCAHDVTVRHGGSVLIHGHGLESDSAADDASDDGWREGYASTLLCYRGGRAGRTAALQMLQQAIRPYVAGRDGLFLSNTWGDRSQDSRVCEAFVMQEIDAAARMGVDVVQIDDGWQKGSSNAAVTAVGGWEGFWDKDKEFWQAHPQRFPRGLGPVVEAAKERGLRVGLWYAPDSRDAFANWQRDAARLVELHRSLGVNQFKIDGVRMDSKRGERNLHRLVDAVLSEGAGRITIDLDVTAQTRPGYFGMMHAGPVFVENRYTDWHRYWPHHTLRNLWVLSQYVHPLRMRMEFLNPQRNAEKYAGDPLGPGVYDPQYLFATVMMGSPLGWFEVSNYPPAALARIAALVAVWKAHRDAIYSRPILPVGSAPDGTAWTGFVAGDPETTAYALLFRELTEEASFRLETAFLGGGAYRVSVLAGSAGAEAVWGDGGLRVTLAARLSFVWVRLVR